MVILVFILELTIGVLAFVYSSKVMDWLLLMEEQGEGSGVSLLGRGGGGAEFFKNDQFTTFKSSNTIYRLYMLCLYMVRLNK